MEACKNCRYWTRSIDEILFRRRINEIEKKITMKDKLSEIVWIPDSIRNESWEAAIREGYEFRDEYGNVIDSKKIVVVKKKKEYPKTYEECCEVLMGKTDFQYFELVLTKLSTNRSEENSISPEPPHISLINAFYKLLICRDAYWKIAGEEMGLGKPWKPDWTTDDVKHSLVNVGNTIILSVECKVGRILAFPTKEMRDAFKENFDYDIEICKELLSF